MNRSETNSEQAYEELNVAILKAITSSEEVKSLLRDFQKNNFLDESTALNLILSLEELEALFAPVPKT